MENTMHLPYLAVANYWQLAKNGRVCTHSNLLLNFCEPMSYWTRNAHHHSTGSCCARMAGKVCPVVCPQGFTWDLPLSRYISE